MRNFLSSFITTEWAGSTIELNTDLRRNEVDTLYNRRKPYRVIEKNGRENVTFKKIPEKSWRYIRDFVTTLVRWILPKRFLTFSTTSNTVNNTQTSLDCDDDKLTSDTQILEDTVQLSATDEQKLIKDDNEILEKNANDDDENLESSCSDSSNRVVFGLYD